MVCGLSWLTCLNAGVELLYMTIKKCDLCKKRIIGKTVEASFGYSSRAELCDKCGSPVLSFLKKNKLFKLDPFDSNLEKIKSFIKKEKKQRV